MWQSGMICPMPPVTNRTGPGAQMFGFLLSSLGALLDLESQVVVFQKENGIFSTLLFIQYKKLENTMLCVRSGSTR